MLTFFVDCCCRNRRAESMHCSELWFRLLYLLGRKLKKWFGSCIPISSGSDLSCFLSIGLVCYRYDTSYTSETHIRCQQVRRNVASKLQMPTSSIRVPFMWVIEMLVASQRTDFWFGSAHSVVIGRKVSLFSLPFRFRVPQKYVGLSPLVVVGRKTCMRNERISHKKQCSVVIMDYG